MPNDQTDDEQERKRVAALADYDLTDTVPERRFDSIVRDAASIADAPIAMISLVDDRRQFFKAKLGVDHDEDPIDQSICAVAIRSDEVLVVADAREDERFRDMAGVQGGPGIRFYAGAPLKLPSGVRIGTLCVIDVEPREGMDETARRLLQSMARRTVAAFELRREQRGDAEAWEDASAPLLAGALELLEKASAVLEEAGASAPLAHLAQVIAMVDDLQARAGN